MSVLCNTKAGHGRKAMPGAVEVLICLILISEELVMRTSDMQQAKDRRCEQYPTFSTFRVCVRDRRELRAMREGPSWVLPQRSGTSHLLEDLCRSPSGEQAGQ